MAKRRFHCATVFLAVIMVLQVVRSFARTSQNRFEKPLEKLQRRLEEVAFRALDRIDGLSGCYFMSPK